jgi:hypothetical protein
MAGGQPRLAEQRAARKAARQYPEAAAMPLKRMRWPEVARSLTRRVLLRSVSHIAYTLLAKEAVSERQIFLCGEEPRIAVLREELQMMLTITAFYSV